MYALIYIGLILEPYLGKARFFSAYILSGIAGSVASLHWNELTVSAGASGAIFGMYGVFLALLTTNLIEKSARKAILTSIIVFVGYNLLNGLQHQGIDNAAHIGGLTSGLIFGYAFYPSLIKPKRKVLKTATILLLIALVSYPSYIVLATTSNDIMTYEKRMEQFASLEEKALSIYNNQQVSNDELLIEIRDNGIPNWEKSISLLKGTDSLDIPQHLQDRNHKLIEYCELRIKSYEAIYKSISEDSEEYQNQIEELNTQIEEVINQLSQ